MNAEPLKETETSNEHEENQAKTKSVAPKRGETQQLLAPGSLREGTITRIRDEAIFLDVGASSEAVVPRKDFIKLGEERLSKLSPGDKVTAYIDYVPDGNGNPYASISHNIESDEGDETEEGDEVNEVDEVDKGGDWELARRRQQSGDPIELKIIDQNRGGLIAAFGELEAFIPNSHIPDLQGEYGSDLFQKIKREKIGSELRVCVIEADEDQNRLILSAKKPRQKRSTKELEQLQVGQTVTGQIVNLVKFGAFVDLGVGSNGLIHISEISWQRINHPSEVFNVGDEVTVLIQEVDLERERISLSRRALEANPWDTIEERYKVGDLVEGVVTSVRRFGAFVKLGAGVEGLLHKSELPLDGELPPQDTLQSGEEVLVRVTKIQPNQQRIALSLQQVALEEQLSWKMHKNYAPPLEEDLLETGTEMPPPPAGDQV